MKRAHRTGNSAIQMRLAALYVGAFLIMGLLLIALLYIQLNQALIQNTVVVRAELVPRLPGDFDSAAEPGRNVRLGVEEITQEELKAQLAASRQAVLRRMLVLSGVMLIALSFVAGAVGWHIAGRAMRPLRAITDVARRVADRNLHERITLEGPENEIKDLADALDSMLARLEYSFQSQQRFIANASHELRTPLAINRTLIEVALLEGSEPDERLRQLGTTLLAVNRRHERLIDGLLTLISSEQQITENRRVDLSNIAAHVVSEIESQEPEIDMDVALEPAVCAGDPVLLETVIHNVVDNAVRYNDPDAGWVDVRTYVEKCNAVFVAENAGPMISRYEVPALFEPFQRLASTSRQADQSERPLTRGAGLGLSIVRSVTAAHNGTVCATPRERGGMRVEVRIPAAGGTVRADKPSKE